MNIANIMPTFENLLLQNYLTKFLNKVSVIQICSIGGATYITVEIIAKDNLNICSINYSIISNYLDATIIIIIKNNVNYLMSQGQKEIAHHKFNKSF